MKNLLRNIGKKSKKAFSVQLNSKKKDKVLNDYLHLIIKNKKLILKENLKDIKDAHKKKEFARGLSSFSSEEIGKIMGCHSNEIREILGYVSKSEVVHKDDMVEIS